MKNRPNMLRLHCLLTVRKIVSVNLFVTAASFLATLALGANAPGIAERLALDFPSKPPGLTNLMTIGQPEIDLSAALAEKLGGCDITNLVVPSIAHLLNQSGRFILTHGKVAHCRCVVRLTDLQINQMGGKARFNPAQAGQVFSGLFRGKDSGVPAQLAELSTNVNWSSDKLLISVHCAVSVEIVDTGTDIVLAEDIGEETRTNSAKAIGLELMGVVYGNGNKDQQQVDRSASLSATCADYQSRLVQLASYRALNNMLPKLDRKLLEICGATDSNNHEQASLKWSPASEPLFCSNCGKAVNPGGQFCSHCGTRISK